MGPDGVINTVAGNGSFGFAGDGGLSTSAELAPEGSVVVGAAGSLYIADTDNSRIRRVRPDGIITTVAGTGVPGFNGDGGPATSAALSVVRSGLALGPDGSLYIADTDNSRMPFRTSDRRPERYAFAARIAA